MMMLTFIITVDATRALIKAYKQALEEGVAPQQFVGYMLPAKRSYALFLYEFVLPPENSVYLAIHHENC